MLKKLLITTLLSSFFISSQAAFNASQSVKNLNLSQKISPKDPRIETELPQKMQVANIPFECNDRAFSDQTNHKLFLMVTFLDANINSISVQHWDSIGGKINRYPNLDEDLSHYRLQHYLDNFEYDKHEDLKSRVGDEIFIGLKSLRFGIENVKPEKDNEMKIFLKDKTILCKREG